MVYIKDREGRYTLVNSRYEELFGLSRDYICGKCDNEIFPKALASP